VALGDWSIWMMWKREESKKHKVKAKVDMYLVSFCLLVYSLEGYLVSFLFWPRILMEMHPPTTCSSFGRVVL